MSVLQYNPKFRTLKRCQAILDEPNSNQEDKDTAKLRITEIKSDYQKNYHRIASKMKGSDSLSKKPSKSAYIMRKLVTDNYTAKIGRL